MDDERLKHVLTQRSEQEIPATMDLRTNIRQQLPASAPRRPVTKRPLLVVALVLMTTTAAYALYQSVIQPDPGIQAVQMENRVIQVDQTQTISPPTEGDPSVAVTLDYAYADANRITVAFSAAAQPAEGEIDLFINPLLTDSSGRSFRWLTSSGQQARDVANSTVSGIMSFDASPITDAPAELALSLRLDVAYTTADLRAENPNAMLMSGGTDFSFTLPFNPGRTVAIGQTVTAGDLAIEARQAVIAPSLTRIDVCYDPTRFASGEWLSWAATVSLTVNDALVLDHQTANVEGFAEPTAPCRAFTLPADLNTQTGAWTLTVHDLHNTSTNEVVAGDWSYTFNVE